MSNLDDKLDFYVKHNMNVLFEGKHGIGKSSIILDCFKRNSLKFLYFSASTMDPWVDFIGVPKEVKENDISYIDLIKPKAIADDTIEAIFFDEFNRSPKKVRNAVMELLQFKSINGFKLHKLKIIWSAINPDDDKDLTFDVEKLDPAQRDRFQIYVHLPYKIDRLYFIKTHGRATTDIAELWWTGLDEKIQNTVSPRRLDYALQVHKLGGDMRDVLPVQSNPSALATKLKSVPILEKMEEFINERNITGATEFINVHNNFTVALGLFESNRKLLDFYVPLLNKEFFSSLYNDKGSKITAYINNNKERFKSTLESIGIKVEATKPSTPTDLSTVGLLSRNDKADAFKYLNTLKPYTGNDSFIETLESKFPLRTIKDTSSVERHEIITQYLSTPWASRPNFDVIKVMLTYCNEIIVRSNMPVIEKMLRAYNEYLYLHQDHAPLTVKTLLSYLDHTDRSSSQITHIEKYLFDKLHRSIAPSLIVNI